MNEAVMLLTCTMPRWLQDSRASMHRPATAKGQEAGALAGRDPAGGRPGISRSREQKGQERTCPTLAPRCTDGPSSCIPGPVARLSTNTSGRLPTLPTLVASMVWAARRLGPRVSASITEPMTAPITWLSTMLADNGHSLATSPKLNSGKACTHRNECTDSNVVQHDDTSPPASCMRATMHSHRGTGGQHASSALGSRNSTARMACTARTCQLFKVEARQKDVEGQTADDASALHRQCAL
eukprot:366249-Chlamydomonas_euryale.AAC.9